MFPLSRAFLGVSVTSVEYDEFRIGDRYPQKHQQESNYEPNVKSVVGISSSTPIKASLEWNAFSFIYLRTNIERPFFMKKMILITLLILTANTTYAAVEVTTTWCTYRSENILLGSTERISLNMSGGNICVDVNAKSKDATLSVSAPGRFDVYGIFGGQEVGDEAHEFKLKLISKTQRGTNRYANFYRMVSVNPTLKANIYFTIFTDKNNKTLDTLALFSYHLGETFEFDPAGYTKNNNSVEEEWPEISIPMVRSLLK